MAIVEHEAGGLSVTDGDVELFAALSIKSRLHLELAVPAFAPQMGKMLRQRGIISSKQREAAYREFCALKGLDPSCNSDRYPEHNHGHQRTFRVKDIEGVWHVIRGGGLAV